MSNNLPVDHSTFLSSVSVSETITPVSKGWKNIGVNTYFYFNEHGQYSNDPNRGYAVISFWDNGKPQKVYKYQNGQKHSTLGPEMQAFDSQGNLEREEYWVNGIYCKTKEIWEEKCKAWGKRTELDVWKESKDFNKYVFSESPTYAYYTKYENGFLHSTTGPAHKIFTKEGKLFRDEYFQNGKLHCLDGPAIKNYGDNTPSEMYYISGKKYDSREEWQKAIEEYNRLTNPIRTYRYVDPSTTEEKLIKVNMEAFQKYFGPYVKCDEYGNPTNIKVIAASESTGPAHYSIGFPDTIFVRENGVAWYNSSNVLETSAWLGPCEVKFDQATGDVVSRRYFLNGMDMSYSEWLKNSLAFVDGLPNWLRFTELRRYGFPETMTVPELQSAGEVKEKVKVFFDSEHKKFAYTYDKQCFLLIKSNDRVLQKAIPLFPGVNDNGNGMISRDWERHPETYKVANILHGQGINNVNTISKVQFHSILDAIDKHQARLSRDQVKEILDDTKRTALSSLEGEDLKMVEGHLNGQVTNQELEEYAKRKATVAKLTAVVSLPLMLQPNMNGDLFPKVQPQSFMEIAKSDAGEVAKRIAAAKITSIVHDLLLTILGANKTLKQKQTLKENLQKVLASENGRAITSFSIGLLLPLIQSQLDPKYHSVLSSMSQEFRVQGETVAIEKLYDMVASPIVQTVKGSLNAFVEEPTEPVRVATDTDREKVQEEFAEQEINADLGGNKYLN